MNGCLNLEVEGSEFVEVDPTGRYGRYNEILGKGASKTVYRAFDEFEGIEVAWNQVKLYDFLQSPEDLERLYSEIHLLKTLKHKNIMKFYTSWVDTTNRNINFVTEMFTSGTLRQYRLKHRKVNIRAVKHWCRQILKGLLYLHSHDPPVIHRDLKCDNIFINGNQGEVKIGDLGLAAILRKSHAARCVGTPEFMAPEVYKEEYNELVDIYSFGMCVLEMVTFEYPYSECTHHAQIYNKVISGKKPDALYNLKDLEVRAFIEKCLASVSSRLSARELLNDPFLQIDDYENDLRAIDCRTEFDDLSPFFRQPLLEHYTSDSSNMNSYSNGIDLESFNEWGYQPMEMGLTGIGLFEQHEDDHSPDVDITIKGKKSDDGSIFLRLRIADKEGRIRNIYFPFDIELDTALSVATEMVAELDITDQDVTSIADMIDGEIATLVPDWKPGPVFEETPRFSNMKLCQNCVSNHTSIGSFIDLLSNNPGAFKSPFSECPNGCPAAIHGRFEEFMYDVEGSETHTEESLKPPSGQSSEGQHIVTWDQCESVEFSSLGSGPSHSDGEHEKLGRSNSSQVENSNGMDIEGLIKQSLSSDPSSMVPSLLGLLADDCENELQWELRWLKAKHQLEFREAHDNQMGTSPNSSTPCSCNGDRRDDRFLKALHLDLSLAEDLQNGCPISRTQRARNSEVMEGSFETQKLTNATKFFTGSLLPSNLHRTTSLPVDAVYI